MAALYRIENDWILRKYDSDLCDCGMVDTVEHFLCECPQYDISRNKLLTNLRNQLGITRIQQFTLLGYNNPEISNWRETVLFELGKFVESSNRLKSQY